MAIKAQMDAAESSVRGAGWLDESPDGLNPVNTKLFEPDTMQPGSKWKAAVQDKRQQVLSDRIKHIPSVTQQNGLNSYCKDPNSGNVLIVDKSYLMKSFKAKAQEVQEHVDQTVCEYSLNTEQERAFRIVANHAVTPESEQLKMYLGGMGGTGKSQVIKALIHFFGQRNNLIDLQ